MNLFYKEKKIKLHLREISRRTKLFEPSTHRFLNELEKQNLLKSEKDANLKKYSIKKTTKTYLIFQTFDLEKFEKLPKIKQTAIKTFLNSLTEKPIHAVLFGSTAKETYDEESDIDVLLITNKRTKTEDAEKETNSITAQKISTFQIKHNDFLKELKIREDKVIQSAINTGYPLINHIQYYELIYDERIWYSKIN